jgi:hypothetical protein
VACFSRQKNEHQRTTFHHTSTINSPQKSHVLHPLFSKTPLKKPAKTTKPRLSPGLHFKDKND